MDSEVSNERISEIAEQVQAEHLLRLDRCNTIPMIPKKRGKRKPNIYIILDALAGHTYMKRKSGKGKKPC